MSNWHPPILYLMVCAAPPAQQTQEVVPLLQAARMGCVRHRHTPGFALDEYPRP